MIFGRSAQRGARSKKRLSELAPHCVVRDDIWPERTARGALRKAAKASSRRAALCAMIFGRSAQRGTRSKKRLKQARAGLALCAMIFGRSAQRGARSKKRLKQTRAALRCAR